MRDLIRGIQNLRKTSGLSVTDRIKLTVSGDAELESAFTLFGDFVANETLASEKTFCASVPNGTVVEADDKNWSVAIEKA